MPVLVVKHQLTYQLVVFLRTKNQQLVTKNDKEMLIYKQKDQKKKKQNLQNLKNEHPIRILDKEKELKYVKGSMV